MSDQSLLLSISNAPSDLQLEKAASSIGISKDGQAWLSYATNLFSDVAIEKARPTDGGPQLSTIIEVPTTFAISKPDSIAADKKWGFHIVQTPFTKPVDKEAEDEAKTYGFMQTPIVVVDFSDGSQETWSGFDPDKIDILAQHFAA